MSMKRGLIVIIWVVSLIELSGQSRYQKLGISLAERHANPDVKTALYQAFPEVKGSNSELALASERISRSGQHLRFNQQFQGIPIQGAGILAHVHQSTIVSCMTSLVEFPPKALGDFSLPESQIHNQLQDELSAYEVRISPVWIAAENGLLPAYRAITFAHTNPASYELLLDAESGEELGREIRDAFARDQVSSDTSGRALVFIPNPCTKAGVAYGDLFTDDDDAHAAIFDGLLDTVVLQDIDWQNNTFYLEGPFVKIEDIAPNTIAPATSTNGDFFFTRDMPGFEDVMVYYHIDRFQRYVQSLGYTNLQNRPFRFDPHGHGDSDNSSFIPDGINSFIKYGEGGVDDAEDADVVIHEYGHALSDAASPNSRSGTERRGLDEGIGDYMAVAYSQQSSLFQWDMLFNWDGHNEYWPGRTASTSSSYPPAGNASIYEYGEIWNSTLMEIRSEIGDTLMDKLVLEELFYNYSGMTLPDAAQILIEVDSILNGEANRETITFYMCQRGILSEAICLAVGVEPDLETTSLLVFPNPNTGTFRLSWAGEPSTGVPTHIEVIDLMGREVYRQEIAAGTQEANISLSVPAGMYLVQRYQREQLLDRQKIQISY